MSLLSILFADQHSSVNPDLRVDDFPVCIIRSDVSIAPFVV